MNENVEFLLKRDDPETKKALMRRYVEKWKYKHDVFISYAFEDAEMTDEIVKTLKNGYKLRVFWSPQIRAGDEFNDTIRDKIVSSKVIAVIFSQKALESNWVMLEIGAGLALQKKIIPACIGMNPERLPNFINSRFQCQPIDSKKGRDKYVLDIVSHCKFVRTEHDENVRSRRMSRRT